MVEDSLKMNYTAQFARQGPRHFGRGRGCRHMVSFTGTGISALVNFTRHIFVVAMILSALLPVRAQEQVPRIVFSPPLDVAQGFRVSYRLRDVPATPTGVVEDRLSVNYRLTVTPIAREKDGYRLRFLVSEIERPGPQDGMDMVVAAALMLDGLPIEMLVDARGFLKEVADWPNVQRILRRRADALPNGFGGIGHSVVDNHDAHQVAWHLARAIDAMNRARSYLDFAERTGASTISWYGSPIDVTVEAATAEGAVAMTWVSPSGASARRDSEGRAVFRRDGFTAQLMAISTRPSLRGLAQEITAVDAIAAP